MGTFLVGVLPPPPPPLPWEPGENSCLLAEGLGEERRLDPDNREERGDTGESGGGGGREGDVLAMPTNGRPRGELGVCCLGPFGSAEKLKKCYNLYQELMSGAKECSTAQVGLLRHRLK